MKKILSLIFLLIFSLGQSQTAAPTQPARNAWDVVSLFAGSYSDIAGTNFNPNWGQSGFGAFTTPSYGGDPVKQYANLNYQGTETLANVNASAIKNLHIDIYSPTLTSIRLSVIKITGGTVEKPITLPLTPATWNSFDIDLTSPTFAGLDLTQIRQFKYDEPKIGGTISNGQTLIVDNIYFWRTATTQPPTLGIFTVPAKLTTDAPFSLTAPTSNSAGAFSYTSSNMSVATIIGNTVTIVGAGTSTITANQAADGPYGSGSTSASLLVTPIAAPTQPARNAWDVKSLFAGAYSDIAGTNFNPNWGQSGFGSFTTPSYAGDPVKQYANLNYQGTETLADVNASAISNLHIDIYSPTLTSIRLSVIKITSGTVEKPITLTLVPGSWNSFDIDLTSATFAGLDLTKIRQFKYDEPKIGSAITNGQMIAVDNIYFWRNATLLPPTVGSFTVAPQPVGAPDFTLTPPTSDNTSPFTYTSSNTNVATIVSGNQIHIVGAGSSTITALQVSDGTYGPSSTPATFVVSYPNPGPSPVPPARDPSNVVSMFTGNPPVYANPVGYNMIRAPWTGGTASDLNFPNGSDTCIKLDNLGFFGYVTSTEPVRFSVVGMTKLHLDIYVNTPLANLFVFLLSNGDQIYNTGPLAAGWNSLDINLSSYPGADLSSIYGFKFEQNVGPPIQIYLDNIYFYVAGTDPTITDFTVPAAVLGDADFVITPPLSNSAGAFSYTSSNPSVATIVNGNEIHVVGIGSSTITANQAAAGIYDAGSITASLVVSAPPLAIAAPTPPARNAWDVVSLYSNAYSNLPSATWQGASSLTDELLEGNDTKKMSNFIVEFINFAATDVSQMTMLHMDVYTPDCTGFNIWLLNNGDRNAQFFPTLNGWYSVDIPLSTYVNNGLNMSGIIQLKFESLNGPGKTVYVDNVYFYRPATLPPATVGTFTVPAKNVGDADFALTPPTSNNSSPFTYTSSNTNVATILGNMVHIVSGGTSTITASQVSDGTYGPTSSSATFVVSFPAPGPSPVPPLRAPSRVMSMYTGTPSVYANNPNYTTVRSFWTGGTTMTEVPNGTNTALRVDNLGYIGLIDDNEQRLDITGMTNLHIDVYLNAPLNSNPALSRLFIFLLAPGDQFHEEANLVAGWNSLNIDLTQYPGANLADIYGLKLEQNTSVPTQIYLDNIYFSDDTHYSDVDGDGYGDLASPVVGQPAGSVLDATDCDDTNATIHPGAVDVCYDGLDNNCDGIIDNGCIPIISVVSTTQCGTTLATIDQYVYANVVSGAQGYRFKVTKMISGVPSTNPADIQTIDRVLRVFRMTQLTSYAFDTMYQVEVSIRKFNVWQPFYGTPCTVSTPAGITTIQSSQCGSTVTAMSDVIYANAVPFATGYRFRIIDVTAGGVPVIIDRPLREVRLSLLASPQFNTTYSIEVAVRNTDGSYLPYGALCNVTSPSFPTTSLQETGPTNYCDYTATSNTEVIYAEAYTGATHYRFRFMLGATVVYTFDKVLRTFTLSEVPGLTSATTYTVQIAIEIGGIFGPYGKACTLTTPGAARAMETATSVVDFKATAYPNPFAENFKLDVKTTNEEVIQIRVYDMLGKLVEDKQVEVSEIRNQEVGANYPSGVYNVIVTQNGNTQTLRMIKR